MFTDYHAKYFAYELTHRRRGSALKENNMIKIKRKTSGKLMLVVGRLPEAARFKGDCDG